MPKIVKQNADGTQEEYAGKDASSGTPDAGEFAVLDSTGKLANSLLPDGVGSDELSLTASENISAGDYLYVLANGQVAKADATAIAKKAVCYAVETGTTGNPVKVRFDDNNASLSALTSGATYYLSATTAGAVTTTAPTTADHIVQSLGVALNATTLHSNISDSPIIRK